MADLEKVHIKLGLSGTYWRKRPMYRVVFNGATIKEAEIVSESGIVEYIEFDAEYTNDQVALQIQLLNKENTDTVESPDKSAILKDMLLNIVSLEVDEIDLGQIPFTDGVYTTNTDVYFKGEQTRTLRNCVNLGWNGTWELAWTNPFYIWLLEKI